MSDMRRRARACAVGKQPFVLINRQPRLAELSFAAHTDRAERLTDFMVAPIPTDYAPPIRYPAIQPWLAGTEMHFDHLKRRDFITLLGGAASALPLGARAQQSERVRRIGVLTSGATADDPDGRVRTSAFLQGLQQSGWIDGRNIQIDYRWGAGDADNMRKYAAELVTLAPDVILASGTATVAPLLQATRTVPIV